MLLQLSHFFFSPLFPSALHPPLTSIPTLQFMSMGHTYKFFGFYISRTILTLPLTLPCLFSTYHLCYLFSVPFPPLSPSQSPDDNLHVIPISVVLFLFQLFAQFAFVFVLGVVINNYEFAVILLFKFLILFFLDKSL